MSKLHLLRLDPRMKRFFKNTPECAPAKYGELLDEHDAAEQWNETKFGRDRELVRQREIVQNEIDRYSNYPHERETVKALEEERAEIEAKRTKLRAETNPFHSLPENFNRVILRFGVNAKFRDARVTVPLQKGETERDALTRTRADIADIYAKRKTVENAHANADEIKHRIAESVDKLAEEPIFSYLLTGSRGINSRGVEWPTLVIVENEMARELPNGAALLAAAFRDELVERLTAKALAKHRGPGLSDAERRRRLAQLDVKLVDAERAEEDLIARLKAAGVPVTRDFRFSDDTAHNARRMLAILGIERVAADDVGEFG